jgi:tetraacyldisaccharide 4'-kinase
MSSSIILPPFAALYGTVTRTRLALYRRGVFKPRKLNAPVISVGNITAGGTGKTPLVEYVAQMVGAGGTKVCILTRGYGRKDPDRQVLVSDGAGILATEEQAGDEPLLLAERLKGLVAVISNASRLAAGQWALANLKSEVFILDDGFQHLQLARDLNILTVDASDPWGGGKLLPRGLLREPLQGLSRADCIVLTRSDQADNLNELQGKIKSINPSAPLFASRMRTRGFVRLGTDDIAEEPPQALAAFSAIGNHDSFVRQLKVEGVDPIAVMRFRDHHRYTQSDLDEIVSKAKSAGAQALATTAKDAVKLANLSLAMPCYVLDIEIEIDDEERFRELVNAALK